MTHSTDNRNQARTCPSCLERELCPKTIDYRTTVKLDRTVYDVHVPDLHCRECANCGEQFFGDKADQQIDDALRDAAGLLRSSEILRCRNELGLTQKKLAELIGSSPEAVCRWERGLIVQGRMANRTMMIAFQSPEARRLMGELNANPSSLCDVAPSTAATHIGSSPPFADSGSWEWTAGLGAVEADTDEGSKLAA